MAFVLLLLLSMSTLVQVESSRASGTQSKIKAEQNAYNAALIALSELQKHCGVDQRSTASAGILDSNKAADSPTIEDVPHPHWTGVWSYGTNSEGFLSKSNETWLVSGNHASSAIQHRPEDKLTVPSVELPLSQFANNSETVSVPLIYDDDQRRENGFAYWVSGLQSKADLQVASTLVGSGTAPKTTVEPADILAGRYGLDALGLQSIDANDAQLRKLQQVNDLELISSFNASELANSAMGAVAAGNYGLLTNAREGGFRTDLTSKLESLTSQEASTPWVDFSQYQNLDDSEIPTDNYTTKSPTWGKLRAFYKLKDTLTENNNVLHPQPSTDAQPGISPRIAYASFGLATGVYEREITPERINPVTGVLTPAEYDYPIEILFRPLVVLHNPYNVSIAAQDYMINFFGLAPRGRESQVNYQWGSEGNAVSDHRSGRITFFNNYGYYWRNPDGWGSGQHRRQHAMDLKRGHLPGNLSKNAVSDCGGNGRPTRQRAGDGPNSGNWPNTYEYPPGSPHFILECPEIPPGHALIFTPPDSRSDFDRMDFTQSEALTEGIRDSYYKYPTSEHWVLLPKGLSEVNYTRTDEDWYRVRLWNDNATQGYFDVSLGIYDTKTDEYSNVGPSLMYHNKKRRSYLARLAEPKFEDKIYQTTGRIEHNYGDDFVADNIFIKYGQTTPPGANSVAWHMIAHDMVDPRDHNKNYNPYKYFNPRAKIMERSDLIYRKSGANRGVSNEAVKNPSENYFYDIKVSVLQDQDFNVGFITYPGHDGPYVAIGGGLREPIADTMTLYDVPRGDTGLYSLGQLQHFQISDYFDEAGYAIGNSLQSPHLKGDELFHAGLGVVTYMDTANRIEGTVDYSTLDLSWIFNDALWDRYFFSTTAHLSQSQLDNQDPLPNPRLKALPNAGLDALQDADEAASQLLVAGAFNVNSTSVDAWKSLLAGNHAHYQFDGSPLESPFFRLFQNDLTSLTDADLTSLVPDADHALTSGHSSLDNSTSSASSDSALTKLAQHIVEQVKRRGPFTSLAEFVNRKRLLDTGDAPSLQQNGALQSAIDDSEINIAIAEELNVDTAADISGFDHFDSAYLATRGAIKGSAIEGLPGMLSQADILTAIGPFISTRSDTFTITSYGEHTDAHSGQKTQALLELTVQRMPEYMDPTSDSAITHPDNLNSALNRDFGRRFTIVGSRWLDPQSLRTASML